MSFVGLLRSPLAGAGFRLVKGGVVRSTAGISANELRAAHAEAFGTLSTDGYPHDALLLLNEAPVLQDSVEEEKITVVPGGICAALEFSASGGLAWRRGVARRRCFLAWDFVRVGASSRSSGTMVTSSWSHGHIRKGWDKLMGQTGENDPFRMLEAPGVLKEPVDGRAQSGSTTRSVESHTESPMNGSEHIHYRSRHIEV